MVYTKITQGASHYILPGLLKVCAGPAVARDRTRPAERTGRPPFDRQRLPTTEAGRTKQFDEFL